MTNVKVSVAEGHHRDLDTPVMSPINARKRDRGVNLMPSAQGKFPMLTLMQRDFAIEIHVPIHDFSSQNLSSRNPCTPLPLPGLFDQIASSP
jgi:hypothetical protein